MSAIYNDLINSGQAFLYVFVSPSDKLTPDIMGKRAEQLQRLSEMYAKDSTYSPSQMIDILRQGIVKKYGKQPELILQIIAQNAIRINTKNSIGQTLDAGNLTFDPESNQYYDGSGNAFLLDGTGNVVSKNGQYNDLIIESPASLEYINVGTPKSGSTFWQDVVSVIDQIIDWLSKLGVANASKKVNDYSPHYGDYSGLTSQAGFGSGLTTVLPYMAAAGIIYYLFSQNTTGRGSSNKKPFSIQK